ncbi:formyltetrahydrofolate deformylase [Acidocella aminolytica]|jgi:formyltetrahydrofolate deformylase|uniref:Formyltetrahydrofolate deformylase n=1 Tax=Acidocella aminolytica 101 = DSM 11237 TaxID=1120923 RepID=A0A0D6PKE5_9PROT|nr:formyltetrahydrofolate deformylase [Acidocella aminolytica]GAN81668.1 formyltetrahydrofolate deformylase [Acidocella aminolytica 101 = DSM 11237]GBQ40120.1 formyltetrahydrofolate deformylase [Acidocella aminolytica 101 = DSM 11237]SHF19246.1 formyltetrahydrofolate deformylase [Acidocella aminolytica 101 = DSM 11237]
MTVSYTLSFSCPDRAGIIAQVSGAIFEHRGNIRVLNQFNDPDTGLFFMRMAFVTDCTRAELERTLGALAQSLQMKWELRSKDERQRVLLLVSKFDHCLADLLYRTRIGELDMEICGIVSNHPKTALKVTELGAVPFHHLSVGAENRAAQEAQILGLVKDLNIDLVILARYMQILSDSFAAALSGRCINIHHSFLPSFKGAKPYHQAYANGVKMIGATAHYVTADLDEGPIIYQDVEAVSHADMPDDLVRKGRNIEQRVLSRAVSWHLAQRVLMNGNKTVVFWS